MEPPLAKSLSTEVLHMAHWAKLFTLLTRNNNSSKADFRIIELLNFRILDITDLLICPARFRDLKLNAFIFKFTHL